MLFFVLSFMRTDLIVPQHSSAEISIEQLGERIITIHTVEDVSIYDLHHLYFDLKRLLMLLDGQFYPPVSVTQDGVEITTSIKKKLLPNYQSADFMIGENNRLISYEDVLLVMKMSYLKQFFPIGA